MSAIIPAVEFELAAARSEFIDAHNAADSAVRARLVSLKSRTHQLLGHNIEALNKVAASPTYSKQKKAKIDALLDQLRPLQTIRCDIVHSRMEYVVINGLVHGFFANVQKQPPLGKAALLLTLQQLRECSERLTRIADDLAT